jgi:carboxylesterase
VSGRTLLAGLAGGTVEERVLEDSYHVATLDHDAPTIFEGSLAFVRAHAPAAAG